MTFFIMEAGGDAAISALMCLKHMGIKEDVVCADAEYKHPGFNIIKCKHIKTLYVENNPQSAYDNFMRQVVEHYGIIFPTGEYSPSMFFNRNCKFDTMFLPTENGWKISRDKKLLAQTFDFSVKTSDKWTDSTRFVKPRYGVGSRSCRIIHTEQEGLEIAKKHDVVFVEYIPDYDYVVDVVYKNAWTRVVYRQRGGADTDVIYKRCPEIEEKALYVAKTLGAKVANVQFRLREDNTFALIDVGTRLSGGTCMSLQLGCNPIALMLDIEKFKRPTGRVVRRFEEVIFK